MRQTAIQGYGGVGKQFTAWVERVLAPGYCEPFADGSGGIEVVNAAAKPWYVFEVIGNDRLYNRMPLAR